MAEVFPFQAYRFNPARVDLAKVLTQPYDKITPAMQERYYALASQNLIAVEKGKAYSDDTPANNVYTRAAQALKNWITQGALVRDAVPSIYIYLQDYQVPRTRERKVRKGFIALGRVEDYAGGVVFRHEQTLAGPRADRLELLRHTRAHTGQLFMLYADPQQRIDALLEQASRAPAPVEVRDEYDVVHRLWPVADAQTIECIRNEMADKKLVIADGHHRYETALAYRNECRAALVPGVPAAQRQLDVVLLHRLVLEKGLGITAQAVAMEKNITYEREMDAAIAAVDRGQAQLCCLLNPVRVEQVAKIALGGEVLPQKSTDFYPNLLSGLAIYCLYE